jgi:hypothetical protein
VFEEERTSYMGWKGLQNLVINGAEEVDTA